MVSIDDAIIESADNLFGDAIVRDLKANGPLMALIDMKVYRHNPESIDTFNEAEKIIVWPEPNLITLNPMPGDYAHPRFGLVIMYITRTRNDPYYLDEIGPLDVLTHIEKILERGTVNPDTPGIPYTVGRLADPHMTEEDMLDPLIPDTVKFLNRMRPKFQKRSKRIVYQTSTTAWPLLVTYDTTSTREERRPA